MGDARARAEVDHPFVAAKGDAAVVAMKALSKLLKTTSLENLKPG
jgi:hypothetical protein